MESRSVASRAPGTGHCVRAAKGCRRLLGLETVLRWPVQLSACIWGRARATGGTLHSVGELYLNKALVRVTRARAGEASRHLGTKHRPEAIAVDRRRGQ